MATYSIIIRNGMVFDGKGNPPEISDVGIIGDKIKKIGNLSSSQAGISIDASNKYVSPGFIDLTTHSDTHWTLFSQPTQESFIRQGVTTIMGGHGGSSLAPLVRPENIEAIGKWVDVSKINVNWQSVKEFLDEIERRPIGVNFGTFIGYGMLRRGTVGNESRTASTEEMAKMDYLAEKSFKEGAFGLSMDLGASHQKPGSDEEIISLFKTAKKAKVFISHHLENEGKDILPAIARAISLARNSGVRSHISHFKAVGKTSWQFFPQGLQMIENCRKEKVEITCDFFPYNRTGSNLYSLLPKWARENGKEKIIGMIKGKERKLLIDYLKDMTLHYNRISIASTRFDSDAVGKTIFELSQNSGREPEEIILDLLDINNLQVSIFNEAILEENIELLAEKDYSAVSSDGVGYDTTRQSKTDLPHPRSFGSFPRFFVRFVKEKGILKWETAIHKMTGLPAEILSISDRGIIEKDAYADITIFDPETISDQADYINPFQYPFGINCVLVNGGIALKDGLFAPEGRGRVLRHFR